MSDVYQDRPSLYIGFHGCEKKVGVVYGLGRCLDLTDKHFIDILAKDYPEFVADYGKAGLPLPQNTDCIKGFFLPRMSRTLL